MYTIERLKRDHPIVILTFSYSLHVSPFLSQGCDFLFNTCLNVNLKLIQLVELKTFFFFTIDNSVWILFHFFSLRVWKKKEQNKNGLLTVLRKSDRSQTPLNRRSACKENCLSSILVLFFFCGSTLSHLRSITSPSFYVVLQIYFVTSLWNHFVLLT